MALAPRASTRHWGLVQFASLGQDAHDLTAIAHTQGKKQKKSRLLKIRELTVWMDSRTAPMGRSTWQEVGLLRADLALGAHAHTVTLRTPARLCSAYLRCV